MQRTKRSFIKNAKERKNVALFWKERMPNPGDREGIAQVAHQKWANEWIARFFERIAPLLIFGQKTSDFPWANSQPCYSVRFLEYFIKYIIWPTRKWLEEKVYFFKNKLVVVIYLSFKKLFYWYKYSFSFD